jgi:NAD(P)-dependent dehydrogenase (short-subunit alcohol dehydrogenase family)
VDVRLDDQVVVISGASRGIGLAIAAEVLEAGGLVVLSSRKEDNLREAVQELGGPNERISTIVANAGRSEEVDRVIDLAVSRYGRLDGLVNNAATSPYYGPLVDIDDSRMTKTYDTNLAGVMYAVRAAWHAAMKDHGGAIVNVASIGGLGPGTNIGWYNVTKAAVIHLTKQLAFELGPKVRVNAVAPGVVRTDMARALWENREEALNASIPLHRIGEPVDIAKLTVFLLSSDSSWITGQTHVIDGGTTIRPSRGLG